MAYPAVARRFQRLIASWRRHGIRHVLEVFRQERIRRAYARFPAAPATRSQLRNAFSGVASEGEDLVQHLLLRSAKLFPVADGWNMSSGKGSAAGAESDAELIAAGRFPALGICIADPSGTFDWHQDYGSGKTWPKESFSQIRYLDGDGADVKYVWELSRMYWIAWLGKAYLTCETEPDAETWAKAFQELTDDWCRNNPLNVGVNWTVSMEVGIRAFWLSAGGAFFASASVLSPAWWLDYFSLLWNHGTFILNNFEYFPNLTNHYIANCFGLLAVGALFKESREGERWYNEGKRRLEIELTRQITRDGVNYERSICYHGLVLEMYLIAAIIAERVGDPFGPEAKTIIERMAEFTADYTPPGNGTIPQLGDSDDGVILRMRASQNLYDHRRLLGLAGEVFNRNDFRALADPKSEDLLLFFGQGAAGSIQKPIQQATSPLRRSRLYDAGGFAALRNEHLFMFADVGEIGLHGNNDTLSFTLHSADGTLWLADPGTGCYTRDEGLRNALRSTAAHNAPFLDQTEIARFTGLWRVGEDRTKVTITDSTIKDKDEEPRKNEPIRLTAEHHAYDRLPKGGATVCRSWSLEGAELSVRDRITGSGDHDVSVRFTIPPEIAVRRIDETTLELSRQKGESDRNSESRLVFGCSHTLQISEGLYSPGYGTLLPCVQVEISIHGSLPLEIAYFYRLVL